MPKAKHEQMDFKGLELVADEFTGTLNGTVTGLAVDFATVSALQGDWRGEGPETLLAALTALQGGA